MTDDAEDRSELAMPYVVCRSRGGPYDDEAFAAGMRLGRLEERLSARMLGMAHVTLAAREVTQADLIAMRHGYTLDVTRVDDVWCKGELRRIPMSEPSLPR